ncbi:MAG TPA: aspartate carbamoyltransferase catalytic subunit [Aquifex aeolicus]|nr:aspartate carbamoyltransferase catalytic subunit [Aquificales bacterium]HIQ26735.1 aspartate carbamoyltransferase catalytic subunit [Aquifex aeolicus]
MKKLLSVRELSTDHIEEIFKRAKTFKEKGFSPKHRGEWVLMFLEPSTRTRLSFEKALRRLGIDTYLFISESSSMKKGETLRDTVLTLAAQGFEGFVIRTPINGHFREIEDVGVFVVNAGDGTNEHPTQALIDAFTLREVFGNLKGLKVLYVGDTLHSRVFRSGVWLFNSLKAKVGFCSPKVMKPADSSLLPIEEEFEDIDTALRWCDVVIFLRIQKERQSKPLLISERGYLENFGLTPERADFLRKHKKVYMHPGPVNRNVEIADSEIYGEGSLILKQVENGVFVRAGVVDFLKRVK